MNLEQVRRMGSLAYQLHKQVKRLDSVQRRLLELLAELPAQDSDLSAEVLLTVEGNVAQAMLILALMRERLNAVRNDTHQKGDAA